MASRRIQGITIEINGDTTKLNTALKDVDKQLKTTKSALGDINKLLKLDPGNAELLTQKQKELAKAIETTKSRLSQLKSVNKDAMSTEEYDAVQREIVETEANLKDLQKEYKNFGSVAAQQLAAAGEKMKNVGDKVSEVGKGLTTRVTLPLVAIGTAASASFAEVDKTMQLTNKTMGSTEEEAKLLNQAMKEAAANSTFGMSDAATATLNFARAGLDAAQAADTLAPAMNLAAGEGGNLDTVSAGLVATINGFHDNFDQAAHYADVFASACNNSALDVDGLSHAMSVAAPVFAAAGYEVEDAALYLGVMANNGIDADKAANSLKTGLARLVSPAKQGAEMMEKLGISVTNADGTMKDSVTIQAELHDAFGRLSEAEQIAAASAIFGKNQMAPWLALINTAPEDVDDLENSLSTCAGTTQEMADTMMSGFGGSIEKIKSSIDVLVTSIGESLAPIIQKAINKVQGWVDKFNSLDDGTKDIIVRVGLAVAAIGPVVTVIGKVISGVGSVLKLLPTLIGFMTGPAGIVVAIGGVIAAGVYMVTHWEEVKQKAKEIWEKIKGFFKDAWEKIKAIDWAALGTAIWTGVSTAMKDTASWLKARFDDAVTLIKSIDWAQLGTDIWNWIKNSLMTIGTWLYTKFTDAVSYIKEIDWAGLGTSIWDWIKNSMLTIGTWLFDKFTDAVDLVKSIDWAKLGTDIWNWIKNSMMTIGTWLYTKFTDAVSYIKEIDWAGLGTSIWDWIKNSMLTIGTWLFDKFTDAVDLVKSIDWAKLGTDIWNWIKNSMMTIGTWLYTKFTDAVDFIEEIDWAGLGTKIWNWIKNSMLSIGSWFSDAFDNAVTLVKDIDWAGLGTDIWNWIKGSMLSIGTWLYTKFTDALDWIGYIDWGSIGDDIWYALQSALYGIGDWLIGVFKAPLNAVIRLVNSVINGVETGVNFIIDGINDKLGIDWTIPNPFGDDWNISWSPGLKNVYWGRLRELYKGGTLSEGQHAVVGEYAPEYLRVIGGQAVVTPIQGADRGRGGDTVTNNFNIYAQPGQNVNEIANAVQRIMTRQQQQREAAYA